MTRPKRFTTQLIAPLGALAMMLLSLPASAHVIAHVHGHLLDNVVLITLISVLTALVVTAWQRTRTRQ
jgi:hypothetical protein